MINLNKIDDVRALQLNMRASLDTPQGKEVMNWLDQLCGWYDFTEQDKDRILMKHGARQILATIKTVLRYTPEQIVAITKQGDQYAG